MYTILYIYHIYTIFSDSLNIIHDIGLSLCGAEYCNISVIISMLHSKLKARLSQDKIPFLRNKHFSTLKLPNPA